MPKIYCTRCGREIHEGTLYCDRCGQSVKKSIENQRPLKYRQIEEIHKERVNRKKRQEQAAEKRKAQKKKALKRTRIIVVVLFLLLVALISAVAAYLSMSSDTAMRDMDDIREENVNSTPTPMPTSDTAADTDAPVQPTIAYTEFSDSGMTCSYPSYFTSVTAEGNELLRLTDNAGGAVITISKENQNGKGKDLMLAYMASRNASEATAGNDWYALTFTDGDKICHRKMVIKDGIALYYDFVYDASSSKAGDYSKYITEMDALFKD